jgi:hypothetical protein
MACRFEITLPGEDARHVATARQALDEVETIEEHLSAFRHTTALERLNRCAAIAPVVVDRPLLDLLCLCRRLHRDTDGAFDVTSTPLSRCWGFTQHEPRVPAEADISAVMDAVGMDYVDIVRSARPFTSPRRYVDQLRGDRQGGRSTGSQPCEGARRRSRAALGRSQQCPQPRQRHAWWPRSACSQCPIGWRVEPIWIARHERRSRQLSR